MKENSASDHAVSGKIAAPLPRPGESAGEGLRVALLAAPYAASGGGMGRIMAYLAGQGSAHLPGWRLCPVETRGPRGLSSPWHMARALARVAAAPPGGVLHVNLAEGASLLRKGLLLQAARRRGMAGVLHLHAAELEARFAAGPPALRAVVRANFRAASRVIVLGRRHRDFVCGAIGIDPARVVIVPNGVPDGGHDGVGDGGLAAVEVPARRGVLFVGNVLPRKGLGVLIAALAMLPPGCEAPELVVIGGGDTADLRAAAGAAGLAGRLRILGWQDHARVVAEMRRAALLVLPSRAEALPLVILEALSAGLPVVASDVGMIGEYAARPGQAPAVLLVPPDQPIPLAAAMASVLTRPDLAASLSAAGRVLYEARFGMAGFARAIGAVWEAALDLPAAATEAWPNDARATDARANDAQPNDVKAGMAGWAA